MDCGSGDIMILVCHVISQDNVIKGSARLNKSPPYLQSSAKNTGKVAQVQKKL